MRTLHIVDGGNWYEHIRKVCFLRALAIPGHPTMGVYPREMEGVFPRHSYKNVHSSFIWNRQNWTWCKGPSVEEGKNKFWLICTMRLYLAEKEQTLNACKCTD